MWLVFVFLATIALCWGWDHFIRPAPSTELTACEICNTPEPDILSARKIFPEACPVPKPRTVVKYRTVTVTKNICERPYTPFGTFR